MTAAERELLTEIAAAKRKGVTVAEITDRGDGPVLNMLLDRAFVKPAAHERGTKHRVMATTAGVAALRAPAETRAA